MICGQYIDIAIPVKNDAIWGEMPWLPMLEATEANDCPGCTNIGQTDCPSEAVAFGSMKPMPALFSAERKESLVGSACAGAATVTAVATPTNVTVRLRFALFTVATLVYSGHIDNTVR